MKLTDYQEIAWRTVNKSLENIVQLQGMVLGIVGEQGELRWKIMDTYVSHDKLLHDIKDEGGDVLWYVANLCTLLSIDWTRLIPEQINKQDVRTSFDSLFAHTAILADVVKKTANQNHSLDLELALQSLEFIVAALSDLLAYYDLNLEEVCTFNAEKLKKRYPNGFEAERSINRE